MTTESIPVPKEFLVILRRRDLEQRLKLSRSTIYDKINPDSPRYDATFTKPIRLGSGSAVGWIESEVEDWLRNQIEVSRLYGPPRVCKRNIVAQLKEKLQSYIRPLT